MARFKYKGEKARPWATFGNTTMLQLPTKDGRTLLTPVPPATKFTIGTDIGYDITDPLTLKSLRTDTRFEEIV